MRKKSVKRGIESYNKAIKEHEEKIRKEEVKDSTNSDVIRYWEKEMKGFLENKEKLIKRFEKKKK